MDKNAIQEAVRARAAVVDAGAAAALAGRPRTGNPHAVHSEDWANWSEGFDQQAAWSEAGRGPYRLTTDTALARRG